MQNRWTELALLALATWRIASLLSSEDGPFDVFDRIRRAVGVWYDDMGIPHGRNTLAKGIICLWCVSVWAGVGWALVYWLWRPAVWLALPFALSALAIAWEAIAGRKA